MKKNRPGVLVTVLATPETRELLTGILFRDTTTIGVRYQDMMRERLDREVRAIATPLGDDSFQSRPPRRTNDQCGAGVRRLCPHRGRAWFADQGRSGHCREGMAGPRNRG